MRKGCLSQNSESPHTACKRIIKLCPHDGPRSNDETVNIHTRTHTGVIHTPTTWQRRPSTFTTTKVTTTTFTIIAVTNTSMTFTNFTSTDERSLSK
ncbi:hypothetical protein M8J77_003288 [Diaphorina citri]|nr:hypothetical protein M8J77_003288 [Diaphorina citri]